MSPTDNDEAHFRVEIIQNNLRMRSTTLLCSCVATEAGTIFHRCKLIITILTIVCFIEAIFRYQLFKVLQIFDQIPAGAHLELRALFLVSVSAIKLLKVANHTFRLHVWELFKVLRTTSPSV